MLSSNNRNEYFRKQEPKKQRFTIKKLTVGVASVLIGFTFMGLNASASADAKTSTSAPAQAENTNTNATSNNDNKKVVLSNKTDQPVSAVKEQNQNSASGAADQKQSSDTQTVNVQQAAKQPAVNLADSKAAESATVDLDSNDNLTNFQNFSKAMVNKDVSTIKLDHDLDLSGLTQTGGPVMGHTDADVDGGMYTGGISGDFHSTGLGKYELGTGTHQSPAQFNDIARTLTIDGQGHTLNMGKWFISFWNQNYGAGHVWNVIIKNVKLVTDDPTNGFAPFRFNATGSNGVTAENAAQSSLTFENVTAELSNGSLVDATNGGAKVNIVVKDSTINENGASVINGAKNVTLQNVKTGSSVTGGDLVTGIDGIANINGVNVTLTNGSLVDIQGDVNFSGTNVVNDTINNFGYNLVKASHVAFNDGDTTLNLKTADGVTNPMNRNGNIIFAQGKDTGNQHAVDVARGATLTMNGQSTDLRGIQTNDGTGSSPIIGSVYVEGNVNANMSNGHSTAIWTANLNISNSGNVTIHTQQDNEADGVENSWANDNTNYNGTHYAPITIGSDLPQDKLPGSASRTIVDNGKLTVIRDLSHNPKYSYIAQGVSFTPLISIGNGLGSTYSMTVGNGATLDLQDNAKVVKNGLLGNNGVYEGTPKSGLITMWGTSGNNTLTFNEPAYVNLQRTGATADSVTGYPTGTLIRLEGRTNKTSINGGDQGTPVSQWDQGLTGDTPSFTWYVGSEENTNNTGDNAISGFGQNATPQLKKGTTFINAGASSKLTLAGNSNTPNAKNSFDNNFNWWKAQRIAIGNNGSIKISDADQYAPETKDINTTVGATLSNDNTTDNPTNVKAGIKDLIGPDGAIVSDSGAVAKIIDWNKTHWYNADTDATEYNKQFTVISKDGESSVIQKPQTADLSKVGTTSNTATIVYQDGSIDFVNVPIKVSDKAQQTLADQYAPDGGTISVAEKHTLDSTDAANAITNKDQLVDKDGKSVVKTDGGYTWKVAPDTTTPGDKAGVVTVTYTDNFTDDVPVVVHVQSQAETNDPQGQDINVTKGNTPNPQDGISNKDDLPTGTTYTWPDGQTPDTSKPGNVPADVVVTYPDGSKDVVPTTVVVTDPSATPSTDKTDADKNNPQGKTINTTIGNVPSASDAITWPDGQPTVQPSSVEWSQTPNVYSKGEHPGTVKVTYPDNSVDYVPTTVNVTNEPTGKTVTTPKDTTPEAPTTIDWGNGTEPTGTTIDWQTPPDVSTPGTHPGTVKITYQDGETTTVPVNVVVTDPAVPATDAFNPYGTTINVPYGHHMTSEDAQRAIAGGVPDGATNVSYTWATTVDTTQPGLTQAYVKVTATIDGQTQTKNVPVYVNVGDIAANYDPQGKNLTVTKGDPQPSAESAISNTGDLPQGTKYTWAIAPDTNTVGTQSDLVKVTYPDNSVAYVPVNVTVNDNLRDADKYQPEYQPVSVMRGQSATDTPSWKDDKTPADGNATFAATADTPSWATVNTNGTITLNPAADTTPGAYTIPVNVTYGDGSTETVYAPVAVNGENTVTYYRNQSTTTITVGEYTSHKTTDGTADVPAPKVTEIEFKNQDQNWKVLSSVTYKLQGDKYVATTPIVDADGNAIQISGSAAPQSFSASGIQTSWEDGFKPNTNASTYESTGSKQYPGSGTGTSLASTNYSEAPYGDQRTQDGQSLPGNSKTRVNITLSGDAAGYFGSVARWCNTFGNIYGATTGETLTFKQNQDISNLTQDQYRQLINVTDLGQAGWNGQNVSANTPAVTDYTPGTDASRTFTMGWAPGHQPSTATVADGVPGVVRITFNDGTHLDVPAHINVTGNSSETTTDADKYTPSYDPTTGKALAPVATGTPKFTETGVTGNVNAPTGTTYSFAGQTTQTITDKNGQNPVEATIDHDTGVITFTAPDDATEYDIPVTVTYEDGSADTAIAKVFVDKTLDPTNPTIDPKNPGEDSDMFTHPTRTINVKNPNTGATDTTKQTVWFGRQKTVHGNGAPVTYGDYQLGKIENGHFVIDPSADNTWPEFDAPTFTGFTPSQTKVDAQTVDAKTADIVVNITYTKSDNGNHGKGDNTHPTPTPGDNGDHHKGNGNDHNNDNGKNLANNNNGVKNTNNGANNNAQNNQQRLPQTGNDHSAAVAGLGLAGLTALLGLAGLKKRKKD